MHHERTSGARTGRRLSIGVKLYGAFGAAIGLLLAVGILSIDSLGRVNDEGRTMYRTGPRASVSSASSTPAWPTASGSCCAASSRSGMRPRSARSTPSWPP